MTVVRAEHPVSNVDVVLDGGKRYRAMTDEKGQVLFNDLPVDTYGLTISLNGKPQVAMTVSVEPDRTQIYTIPLEGPKRTPSMEPPSTKPVHESLVTGYNAAYPVYTGNHYFGRYTYVLLFGAAAANRSLIASLNAGAGLQLGVDNPLGYNLFAIPLNDNLKTTGDSSVNWILENYNASEAKAIRNTYCDAKNHSSASICSKTWDSGPVLMTFLRPLDVAPANGALPPALAYDLSRVPASQMAACVRQLSKAIVAPDDVSSTQTIAPASSVKFVTPVLGAITTGVRRAVPEVEIVKDAGFESTNEIQRAAISSESAAASPRP